MVQIIKNGTAIGRMSEANAKTYIQQTTMMVVSQTATTICVKG